MKKCMYQCCRESAVKGRRCRKHHVAYLARRDASAAQPKCAKCKCCLPLGWRQRMCDKCATPTFEMHITLNFYIPKD